MRSWLRRYALRSGVVTLVVIVASITQILNGLPDLVDRDLPWLGNRVNAGLFAATIWQIAWVVPLVVALGLLVGIYRNSRAGHGARPERGDATTRAKPGRAVRIGHDLVGFGRDWVRCRCGWTGSGSDATLHQAGDPIASTNQPVDPPPVPDRAALVDLAIEAWQELLRNRDLTRVAANADARSKALRRWEHDWEIRVERALMGDEITLAAFKHPVDVAQMDYRESPALTIWTKLGLLADYIPVELRVEMDLQERWDISGAQPNSPPKMVFTAQDLAEDTHNRSPLRGSPRSPVATDVAMARTYADKGPQDAMALVDAQRRAAGDYLAAMPPAIRNLPPDRRALVRAEFLRERASLILRGQRLFRILTSMSVTQASQSGVEERWTPWAAQWAARVLEHRADWWSSPGMTVGDLFALAVGADKVQFASRPVAPPPPWRANCARELKVGLDWLDKHAAPEPPATQSFGSPVISSQDQT